MLQVQPPKRTTQHTIAVRASQSTTKRKPSITLPPIKSLANGSPTIEAAKPLRKDLTAPSRLAHGRTCAGALPPLVGGAPHEFGAADVSSLPSGGSDPAATLDYRGAETPGRQGRESLPGGLDERRDISKTARWTLAEVGILRDVYPRLDRDQVLAALPDRTWEGIVQHASVLEIRRPREAVRKNQRLIHPIVARLRAERERQRLSRPALAQKAGYHVLQLHVWEMGKARPRFQVVCDWAQVLGFEIVLKKRRSR